MNQNQETIDRIIYALSDATGDSKEEIKRKCSKCMMLFDIGEKQALDLLALQHLPFLIMNDEEVRDMRGELSSHGAEKTKDVPLKPSEFLESVADDFRVVVNKLSKLWMDSNTSVLSICKEFESSFQYIWFEEFYDLIYTISTSNHSQFLGQGITINSAIKGLFEYIKYALTGTDREFAIASIDEIPESSLEIEQVPEKALKLLLADLESSIPPAIEGKYSYAMAVIRDIVLIPRKMIEINERIRIRLITPFEWNGLCNIISQTKDRDNVEQNRLQYTRISLSHLLDEVEYHKEMMPEVFRFAIIEVWEKDELEFNSSLVRYAALYLDKLTVVKRIEDVISCIRLVTGYLTGTTTVFTVPGIMTDSVDLPPGERNVSVSHEFKPAPVGRPGRIRISSISEVGRTNLVEMWQSYRALLKNSIVENIRNDIQSALSWFNQSVGRQSPPETMFYLWTSIERLFRGGRAAINVYRSAILAANADSIEDVHDNFDKIKAMRNKYAHGEDVPKKKEIAVDDASLLVRACLRNAIFVATDDRIDFEEEGNNLHFSNFIDKCVMNAEKRKMLLKVLPRWSCI